MQGVRGLEHRRRTPGAPEREQHGLQHLVRAVGAEQPLDWLVELIGERGAQLARVAIRIAVEGGIAERVHPGIDELLRRCVRTLVRVEPHRHVELRRVVPLEGA
jgi:hypothetical protein